MRDYEKENEYEEAKYYNNEDLRDENEVMGELKEYWIGKEIEYISLYNITDCHTKQVLEYEDLEDGKHTEVLQGSYAENIEELPKDAGYLQNVIFYFETVGEFEVVDGDIDIDTLLIKITNIDTI